MEPEVKSVPETSGEVAAVERKRPNALFRAVSWAFVGEGGLRAGWQVGLFMTFFFSLVTALNYVVKAAHLPKPAPGFTAGGMMNGEYVILALIVISAVLVALIARRRPRDYYLVGPSAVRHFLTGIVGGFAALSTLVAGLYAGGWIHFGGAALTGGAIWTNAALWGVAFIGVGCVEEGMFRCFFQGTLARGLNFWWALGIVALACGYLVWQGKGNGLWGVYIIAALGVAPCLLLELRKAEGAGFWHAAWVTSTMFGFVHTGNGGENWVGIFSAAAIGFIFCVSIKLTGSVWWAVGFHAAWDWAETYFYGTSDSGQVGTGHYLTTNPVGNVFWSGGTDGPEGSALIVPLLVVILTVIVFAYARKKAASAAELPAS